MFLDTALSHTQNDSNRCVCTIRPGVFTALMDVSGAGMMTPIDVLGEENQHQKGEKESL